jgi:hypothetical protein
VDPEWENGVQKAMMLVKSDFGDEAARALLEKAKRASEAIAMANTVLQEMPEGWTGGVVRYELSVMFNPNGLPDVCVVARREIGTTGSATGIWQEEVFRTERLPMMHEALMMAQSPESIPDLRHWESRAWCEVGLEDYRALAEELSARERAARRCKGTEAHEASSVDSDFSHSRLPSFTKLLRGHLKKSTAKTPQGLANLHGYPALADVPVKRSNSGLKGLARAVSPASLFRRVDKSPGPSKRATDHTELVLQRSPNLSRR